MGQAFRYEDDSMDNVAALVYEVIWMHKNNGTPLEKIAHAIAGELHGLLDDIQHQAEQEQSDAE